MNLLYPSTIGTLVGVERSLGCKFSSKGIAHAQNFLKFSCSTWCSFDLFASLWMCWKELQKNALSLFLTLLHLQLLLLRRPQGMKRHTGLSQNRALSQSTDILAVVLGDGMVLALFSMIL